MTQTVTPELHAAVQATNLEFLKALASGDAHALAQLYTHDGEVLAPGSAEVQGRAAVQSFWQAVMDQGVASAELVSRELIGTDSDAYEVGQFQLHGAKGEVLDHGKFVVIWRQEDGQWRLHRDIFNSSRSAQ